METLKGKLYHSDAVKERIDQFLQDFLSPQEEVGQGVQDAAGEEEDEIKKHPIISRDAVPHTTKTRKGSSVVDKCGLSVSQGLGTSSKCYFICLMDGCYNEEDGEGTCILLSPSTTSNATKHLSVNHGIVSTKTVSHQKIVNALDAAFDTAAPGVKEDPLRTLQLQLACWAADHAISFNAFNVPSWNLIASMIPIPSARVQLGNLDVPKFQVTQYTAEKNQLKEQLKQVKAHYRIPFLSYSIDLYQNPVNNTKFLCVSVFWVQKGEIFYRNLAIRGYSPTYAERDENSASDLLYIWTKSVFDEFGIDVNEDLITGAGDQGPDVRKVMTDKIRSALQEWCFAHLATLCLVDAFGTSLHRNQSKNLDARRKIETVRKTVEHVNKSKQLEAALKEEQIADKKTPRKLKNPPQHRWGSIEDTLEGVITSWSSLQKAYLRVEPDDTFPLHDMDTLLIEFFSLIKPIRDIQRKSQYTKEFVLLDVFFSACDLYDTLLDPHQPLTIHDPSHQEDVNVVLMTQASRGRHATVEEQGPPTKLASDLHESTLTVRMNLREAFNKRFFVPRYHPVSI